MPGKPAWQIAVFSHRSPYKQAWARIYKCFNTFFTGRNSQKSTLVANNYMRLILLMAFTTCFIACNENPAHVKEVSILTETEVVEFIKLYDGIWVSRDTISMKQAMDEQYIYFTSTGG